MTSVYVMLLGAVLCCGCHPTQEESLSKIRRGARNIYVPRLLANDELQIENDKTALEIAKLQGKAADDTRLRIDEVVLEKDRAVAKSSELVDQILSRPDSPENREDKDKALQLDKQLDDFINPCHDRMVASKTVGEAWVACTDLATAMRKSITPKEAK
jgi:hypothetical protein